MLAFVAFEKITQTFQLFEVVSLPSVGVGVGDVSNYFFHYQDMQNDCQFKGTPDSP